MAKSNIVRKVPAAAAAAPLAAPEILFSVIPPSGNYTRGAVKVTTGAGFVTKQAPFWRELLAALSHPATREKFVAKLAESDPAATTAS